MIPVYMNNEQLDHGRSSKNYRISTCNNTKRIYSLVKMKEWLALLAFDQYRIIGYYWLGQVIIWDENENIM